MTMGEGLAEPTPDTAGAPLFFSALEWATIDAAAARIYPTDDEPGAREAQVVRFIDRYLSGVDFIFANAEGSGFLTIAGKDREAWRSRIARIQETYRLGVEHLNAESVARYGELFHQLDDASQDRLLEVPTE